MRVEDIKLGTLIQHHHGVAKIVAFRENEKDHTVLIRFLNNNDLPPFVHDGISKYPEHEIAKYEYIELDKMHKSCYWITPTKYDKVTLLVEDIEDD